MNAFNQAINGFNSFTQNVGNNPLVQKLVQFGNQMRGTPVMASSGSQQNQTGWKPAPEGGGYYPVYNEPAPFKYLPDPTPRPVTQPAQMQNNNPIVPITRPIQSPVVSPSPITNPIAGFNLTVPGHNGPVAVPQNIEIGRAHV